MIIAAPGGMCVTFWQIAKLVTRDVGHRDVEAARSVRSVAHQSGTKLRP